VRLAALLLFGFGCGGIPQSAECERFLACAEARAPTSTLTSRQTYGPGGTCWQNASDAAACTEVCRLATLAVRADAGSAKAPCK
jgi:uncharacterized protein (UPF0548 family)